MKLRIAIPLCVLGLISAQILPAQQTQTDESTKAPKRAKSKEAKSKKAASEARESAPGESIPKNRAKAEAKSKLNAPPEGMPASAAEKNAEKQARRAGKAEREAVPPPAGTTPMPGERNERARTTTGKAAREATTAPRTVSESEIAAAKASGKVWVNTQTGIYHKGGRWYGATKEGKFMSEQAAMRAGYREAKK